MPTTTSTRWARVSGAAACRRASWPAAASLTASSSRIGAAGVAPVGCAPVREQPEQQAPPVQRLRVRYAKRGRLRFTSHRDFSRAFERAVVRARVPMAYSSGLQPAPADLLRRRVADRGGQRGGVPRDRAGRGGRPRRRCTPRSTRRCPTGSTCSRSWCRRGGSLADLLEASVWRTTVPGSRPAEAAAAVAHVPGRRRGAGRADDQEGAAHLRLPRGGRVA